MPLRADQAGWSKAEVARLKALAALGTSALASAGVLNQEFHGGQRVRSVRSVGMKRTHEGIKVALAGPQGDAHAPPEGTEQEVKRTLHADGSLEILAVGRRIKTVEDAIAHVEADMTRFEVAKVEATAWDTTLVDPTTKRARTIQNHRVYVQLKPKTGPNVREQVEAILVGAFATRKPLAMPAKRLGKHDRNGILQMLGIFDPHIGKRAWGNETRRGHYDLPIAVRTLREANADLIAKGNARRVEARVIFVGGDFFNADTKAGTTTGGTPQDNDSRIPKMLTEGAAALFDIINWSAQFCPTKVMVVPGNHDSTLSWALQMTLQSEFRNDARVTIDGGTTTRKYHQHGKCLLGLTHGDKAWKRLPGLMSRESALEWGQTTLRHIHHGHLHSKRQVDTVEGVTVFQHPALCESDSWHTEEGYVSDRGQETYYYHDSGRFVGMDYYSPDIDQPVSRGVAA